MVRALVLTVLLLQAVPQAPRSSVITRPCATPQRNVLVLYYDDAFLFMARHYGDHSDPQATSEPGLFVHSREKNRWIQVTSISTEGAKLGKSGVTEGAAQRSQRALPVGWDFTAYRERPYIDQPLRTSGSIAFPEKIVLDPDASQYELRYFSSFGVPGAETVLYVKRADLVAEFAKHYK